MQVYMGVNPVKVNGASDHRHVEDCAIGFRINYVLKVLLLGLYPQTMLISCPNTQNNLRKIKNIQKQFKGKVLWGRRRRSAKSVSRNRVNNNNIFLKERGHQKMEKEAPMMCHFTRVSKVTNFLIGNKFLLFKSCQIKPSPASYLLLGGERKINLIKYLYFAVLIKREGRREEGGRSSPSREPQYV